MFGKNKVTAPEQKPSIRETLASLEGASMGALGAQALGLLREVQSKAAEARFLDALELLAVTTYARTFAGKGTPMHERVASHCSEIVGRIIARPKPQPSLTEAVAAGAVAPTK